MQNPVSLLEELMETKINEIANCIYRPAGFTFNQFLVLGDEPLLFHTGLRRMFPLIRTALSRILPPEHLRWISFGHFEADECGAMNEWLAVASQAKVAHGQTGCLVSLNDMADRTPQVLHDGEVIDLGKGKRVRYIDTPHIPHGWDAGVLYEETSRTLLCGDLFTQLGDRERCCRACDCRRGHRPIFQPKPRHGHDDPSARRVLTEHFGAHARPLIFGRRRECTPRPG